MVNEIIKGKQCLTQVIAPKGCVEFLLFVAFLLLDSEPKKYIKSCHSINSELGYYSKSDWSRNLNLLRSGYFYNLKQLQFGMQIRFTNTLNSPCNRNKLFPDIK